MRALLITAGATHNPIDSMRSITANASGKTGAWFAQQLYLDFEITVMGSQLAIANNTAPVKEITFTSTRDLEQKMKDWVLKNPNGIVIHSAAVGDYEVSDPDYEHKISSGQSELSITLVPTPKILPQLKKWSTKLTIVSFKAAPPSTKPSELVNIATRQCIASGSEIVLANVIGHTHNDVMLVTTSEHEHYLKRKDALKSLVQHIKGW
ncbi:MAG: phosphopantothenoylcysteine decarboxylase [Myxococcota bacterium]|nr:phosphopantothenoylcysteine decarboxylase [Myxococcota bacterium]